MLSRGIGNLLGEFAIEALLAGGEGDVGDIAVGGGVCDCFEVDSLSPD